MRLGMTLAKQGKSDAALREIAPVVKFQHEQQQTP
jgi:hypothetical protein